jgi:hypothetical protein
MNAGLSNLATLKGQLLAVSMQSNTNYDPIITAIGLGVAARIDRFCNRRMAWLVGAVDTCRSDRRHWYLERFPVAALTALAKKDSETDGWVSFPLPPDGNSLVQVMELQQGYINFIAIQGYFFSQLQITYNGGFFFNTADTFDAGYSGPQTQPAGSIALPSDIQLAWFLQCQNVWKRYDKLGVQISQDPEPQSAISSLDLCDAAKDLLQPHIRYNMS